MILSGKNHADYCPYGQVAEGMKCGIISRKHLLHPAIIVTRHFVFTC
jgi:hypothetical protein